MSNVIWTKGWSATDNGTIITGTHLQDLQNDISSVVNGELTNANFSSGAALLESKISFDASSGHTHNGTDATLAIPPKHYMRGGKITWVDNANLTVGPVAIDIGGVMITSVAASASIDVSVTANYLTPDGGAQGDEPADGPIYIYAYNSSGSVAYKLGDENSAPTLSYTDDTTVEYPLRYLLDDDGTTYYRLVGVIHNRTNLVPNSMTYIDRGCAIGTFTGDGVTEVITTGWTPKYIRVVQLPDATPAAAENILENFIGYYDFITAAPHPADLNYSNQAGITDLIDEDVAGSITAITPQSAGVAGSFSVYQPVSGAVLQWTAWSDEV